MKIFLGNFQLTIVETYVNLIKKGRNIPLYALVEIIFKDPTRTD